VPDVTIPVSIDQRETRSEHELNNKFNRPLRQRSSDLGAVQRGGRFKKDG